MSITTLATGNPLLNPTGISVAEHFSIAMQMLNSGTFSSFSKLVYLSTLL